jgi:hypothetical protein
LTAEFRNPKAREPVSVVMLPLPGQDIDTSGHYVVTLQIGERTEIVEVQARFSRD